MKLVIHIGSPKAASSTFQDEILSKIDSINYINESGAGRSIMTKILFDTDMAFNKYIFDTAAQLESLLFSNKVNVISSESLISELLVPIEEDFPAIKIRPIDIYAGRIKKLTDLIPNLEVEILVILRIQSALLQSMYAQNYNKIFKRLKKLSNFENFLDYYLGFDNKIFENLCYENLLQPYEVNFPKVRVLSFRDLTEQNDIFFQDMASVVNVKPEKIRNAFKISVNKKRYGSVFSTDQRTLKESLTSLLLQNGVPRKLLKRFRFFARFLPKYKLTSQDLSLNLTEDQYAKIFERFQIGNTVIEERYNVTL